MLKINPEELDQKGQELAKLMEETLALINDSSEAAQVVEDAWQSDSSREYMGKVTQNAKASRELMDVVDSFAKVARVTAGRVAGVESSLHDALNQTE